MTTAGFDPQDAMFDELVADFLAECSELVSHLNVK